MIRPGYSLVELHPLGSTIILEEHCIQKQFRQVRRGGGEGGPRVMIKVNLPYGKNSNSPIKSYLWVKILLNIKNQKLRIFKTMINIIKDKIFKFFIV